MSADTKIQWCNATFNAWWGCVEDGPECDNCYARTFAKRTGHDVWGLGARRFFGAKHWAEPLKWNAAATKAGERRRVFCGSMMDIGECRSDEVGDHMQAERVKLWSLIEQTPSLDWLLLTKRPQNMARVMPESWLSATPRNVWIGTTAGNRDGWEKRVKWLRRLNPAVRFVSVEPQIEDLGAVDLAGIHWVIQGGESGGKARFFSANWAADLRDQCRSAGVAYFMKQLGRRPLVTNQLGEEHDMAIADSHGGNWDEWPEELRVRQFPEVA